MSLNFLGDNSTTISLGANVKDIKFKYTSGGDATIAEGKKANLKGEAYEALVTYNDDTIKLFKVTSGYLFQSYASAVVKFSIAQTTISVIADSGLGAELKLVV